MNPTLITDRTLTHLILTALPPPALQMRNQAHQDAVTSLVSPRQKVGPDPKRSSPQDLALNQKRNVRVVWWHTPIIPALGRLRQEDQGFKASLNYTARSCFEEKSVKKWSGGLGMFMFL
jgi:hypothetical protein